MEAKDNTIILRPGESMHDYKGYKESDVKSDVKPAVAPAVKANANANKQIVKKKQ